MIAPEGRKILNFVFAVTVLSGIAGYIFYWPGFTAVFVLGGLMSLFSLNFFRDPERAVPDGDGLIIAPADGKVIRVGTVDDPDVGREAHLVSIFMNIFNVHVNRVPVTGMVRSVTHRPGKFLQAFDHKASDENERTTTILDTDQGTVKVRQIAGLVARRIHCYAREGEPMRRGERLGFIMFGSRIDVIFPPVVMVTVAQGTKVVGGETIIGRYPEKGAPTGAVACNG
jgi:phosphatidylserine decarboxylase